MTDASFHDAFLQQTRVYPAFQQGLGALFSQTELPESPGLFLAEYISIFHEIDTARENYAGELIADMESCSPVVDDRTRRVCKSADLQSVFGLPHVLRCLTHTGACAINHIIFHNLPHSFFTSPTPRQVGSKVSVLRSICSVHGGALIYRPAWDMFPPLQVRADVVVAARGIDEAIDTFTALILKESRAVQGMPLNQWVDVKVVSNDSQAATSGTLTTTEVEADTSKLFSMVRKAVLSSHVCSHQMCTIDGLLTFVQPTEQLFLNRGMVHAGSGCFLCGGSGGTPGQQSRCCHMYLRGVQRVLSARPVFIICP